MTVLKLYQYPDPILRQKCERVAKVDDQLRRLLDDMLETMYVDKGCGLAAPQVGICQRMIVLDPNPSEDDLTVRQPMYLINPEIIWHSEETVLFNEGCLSLPEQRAQVERFAQVRVHYLDYSGQEQEILADDLLAIILQHEIDHLDGILYIDHLSRLKRTRLVHKLEKFYAEETERKDQTQS